MITREDLKNDTWGGYSVLDLGPFHKDGYSLHLIGYTRKRNGSIHHFNTKLYAVNFLVDIEAIVGYDKYSFILTDKKTKKEICIFDETTIHNILYFILNSNKSKYI